MNGLLNGRYGSVARLLEDELTPHRVDADHGFILHDEHSDGVEGELHGNTPLAYDEANHRIFVVGRKPPSLVVLDSESGKIIASLPTAEMTDDMAFDPGSKRIYVACNDFAVVYLQKDADHYEELGRAPTGFRAKTNILVPQLKRYYVGAPRHENDIAGVKVFEVQ